jgi:DNA-binding transcriptional ArsR family regulator
VQLAPGQAPLYEIKANLFKALAHPARIRALELLSQAPEETASVAYLLERIDIEASHLSQHLKVLRRHHVVVSERRASNVYYTLAHPCVSELLRIAREFLLDNLESDEARRTALLMYAAPADPAL